MRTRLLVLALASCVAGGCRATTIAATSDGGSSTADETSTGAPPSDMSTEPICGDGIVDASEDCEPAGPVSCNDDCTLPADGPGTLEWTFVGDVGGDAFGVAVGTDGRATVGGVLIPFPPGDPQFTAQGWIARFEANGGQAWQIVDAGPGDVGIQVDDVELDGDGLAIVSGGVGLQSRAAWVAAYDDAGTQLWSWTDTPPDSLGSHASALTRLDDRIYAAVTTMGDVPVDSVAHPKPSLAILAADGTLQDTRSWPADTDAWVRSLASDPTHAQIVAVGSSPVDAWNDANWIEALDAAGQTLWTAHDPAVDPPGGGARVIDVAIDPDGGVYVSGDGEGHLVYVRKLDASGDPSWTIILPPEGVPQIATLDGVVYAVSAYFPASGPSFVGVTLRALDSATGALLWRRQVATDGDAHTNIFDLGVDVDSLWVVGERWPPDGDGLWTEGDDFARPWVARFRRE